MLANSAALKWRWLAHYLGVGGAGKTRQQIIFFRPGIAA
jgi:hypothetical protein